MTDVKFAAVTDESIGRLVDEFYTKVRADPALGPVFMHAVHDWDSHLATLRDFWSSVMLTTGRYKGNPVAKHRQVEGISHDLFARWLALFDETARALFEPALAAVFNAKAARIAESLQLAVFYRPDRPWPPTAA
ncbi:preprotein translocase subunit TatC [Pseudolabrys sp. Root1462]|jgi:hemoglobin|uniref:group III truncated hemoglobin n=1 Tax=Pseudolabrys sp. Root1462 TaxID=1736466 RepID=UPI000703A72C|nr:group III truncated hemoglobin [Pseudolabrys sp. Root1462]KQY98210.1 preprotein translocase subunit TatC [Pseudolabrys sp. Root1462]